MGLIDRYLLRLFVKVLLICFLSLVGLYMVIDAFNNLEEFLSYGKQSGGLHKVLLDYYGPRALTFFDRVSGLLSLVAVLFTLTWLVRTNELTALAAAGIAKKRVVVPLLGGVLTVSLLAVANREFVLPQFKHQLTRNAQNWLGQAEQPVYPEYDRLTGMRISARPAVPGERLLAEPRISLPAEIEGYGHQLAAKEAVWEPAAEGRPAGFKLRGVTRPENLAERPSAALRGKTVIYSPRDIEALEDDELFIVSHLSFTQMVEGRAQMEFASTPELFAALRNPLGGYGPDVRVRFYLRLLKPLLDMTLVMLGLPLVLSRENRNVFLVAGSSLLLVAAYYGVAMVAQFLGNHVLIPASLAAFAPLLVFIPIAAFMKQPFWE